MSPIQWAIRPLKNYADFSGRASRAEFWWFFLFMTIIYVVMWFALMGMVGGLSAADSDPSAGTLGMLGAAGIFMILFWLALLIPTLAVQTRRLHDTNRSGWWLLSFYLLYAAYFTLAMSAVFTPAAEQGGGMAVIAGVGIIGLAMMILMIVLLVFYILPGTKGSNKYGPDPYGADIAEVFA